MRLDIVHTICLSIPLLLPLSGSGADLPPTTRQQMVRPLTLPADTRQISPKDVSLYRLDGYSAWQVEPGVDQGRKFNLMPAGYTGATNTARLLSFFSMSDIHITDKESPAQVPYFGWNGPFGGGGFSCQPTRRSCSRRPMSSMPPSRPSNYPNLLLLMAGHRHINTVTPQPSPDPAHPENGFWEVETPLLRDFPQQFRTWEIRRNSDNTISIVTTDVDPQVGDGSPAADSRGYAIGASRIFGNTALGDTTSHTYNAELLKPLSPAMQAKIARLGAPLDHRGSVAMTGNGP